jgi:hypothetical protein
MATKDEREAQERAEAEAKNRADAEEKNLGETVPGGKYLVGADAEGRGGRLVDANGEPVDKKKDD